MSGVVWIGLCILLGALVLEIVAPKQMLEGFQALGSPTVILPEQRTNLLTGLMTRRGDVGPGYEGRGGSGAKPSDNQGVRGMDQQGFQQDRRYFAGYADVQRYNIKNDFCRMVTASDITDNRGLFFACALAGTTGTSTGFRTETVADGFKISRDDYMRDIIKDGRDAYCRILLKDGVYQPLCRRALDLRFSDRDEPDTDPPEEIKTLADFYAGCEMWLRLRDDMVDYVDRAVVQLAGGIKIDPRPNPSVTNGLYFNGVDQFVRFGDTDELSLGNRIKMRMVRAFSVWVKFDAFTNNAHIFDLGDGAGINNVFLGILGKGEGGGDENTIRADSKCPETTVPTEKSGAQFCPEMSPQSLYEISAADVEHWECKNPSVLARKMAPIQTREVKAAPTGLANKATLIYEVWDKKLRKVQIKVNRAIPLGKWTHILITAKNMDAMRPDLNVIINGNLIYTHLNGYLPQAKVTSHNYLGKSNWANDFSDYELRDELFQGSIFDFRMYSKAVSETKGKRILQWGMGKLGLGNSFDSVSG
jgi:hypothetical protein